MDLISKEEIKRFLKLQDSDRSKIVDFVYNKLKLKDLNEIYRRHSEKESSEFVSAILADLGIHFEVSPEDLKRIPSKGGFILLSNHPFGAIDGLIICKSISEKRPDFKLMANFLLQRIIPLKDQLFPVNPFETMKDKQSSVKGVRNALSYVHDGHPLGIFPAGEVAAFKLSKLNVKEKEWDQIVKFILKCNVPVVPAYISGTNSPLFHMLGLIHPLLRTAKLPSEIFNKAEKSVYLKIGHPIQVEDLKKIGSVHAISTYLQLKSNLLSKSLSVDAFYKKPILGIKKRQVPLIASPQHNLLTDEIAALPEDTLLMQSGEYQLYLIRSHQAPNLMIELGRLRELTFREVQEGTNKEIDLDPYDIYYSHLIIWDQSKKALVGSYRIGKGDEIMSKHGVKGFYLHSLFRMKKEFRSYLSESVELGRSFIASDYQRKPTTLFLLWKGILLFMDKNPNYRYLIGPVSMSTSFSKFSKELVVSFSHKYLQQKELVALVQPRKKFKLSQRNEKKVATLLGGIDSDIEKLDKLIQETDKGQRIPILLKKYIGLNAKLISFNVDPLFNNCLDGFIFLDYHQVPEKVKEGLRK